jgi:hypothetical protein
MAQKNDERIMQLKKIIEEKRQELASKPTRFNPITNCLLVFDKVTYNLHIDSSEMLLIKLNALLISAKDLEINTSTLMISGSSLDDWITDVEANLEVQRYKAEKKKLDMLEKQLTALLSDDKQTELQIDSLEELLKDSE